MEGWVGQLDSWWSCKAADNDFGLWRSAPAAAADAAAENGVGDAALQLLLRDSQQYDRRRVGVYQDMSRCRRPRRSQHEASCQPERVEGK